MVSEPSLRREAVVAIAELSLRATTLAHEYTREEGAREKRDGPPPPPRSSRELLT